MKAWRYIIKKRTVLVTACFVAVVSMLLVSSAAVQAQAGAFRPDGTLSITGDGEFQGDAVGTKFVTKKIQEGVDGITGSLSAFLYMVIGAITSAIIWLEGQMISLLTALVIFVVKYNDFANSSAVRIGWTLVRDVANLFFVVVLLAIAIATILRVESYNFKKLLPKLILMAILVNFSKTIAGLILDFAQVVMLTFVAAFAGVAGDGNLISALQVQSIINYKYDSGAASEVGLSTLVGTSMLMVIMLAIAIAVLMVILVVLVMRIVMLWVLVVLSPLAYIMAAFPQGQRYAQQWWQEFSKYVIIGPVLGFFLWLTFAIASAGTLAHNDFPGMDSEFGTTVIRGAATRPSSPAAAGTQASKTITELNTEISRPEKMLSFVIAIAMLMGSLVITQQIGVAGGQFAGSMFNKIRQTGLTAMTKRPLQLGAWTARKVKAGRVPVIGRFTRGLELNPMNVVRGLQESFSERKKFEEMEGRSASGEAMKKGGVRGLIKGLGSSRDYGDAYIKGFANIQGFANMYRSAVGGPGAVDKMMAQSATEQRAALDASNRAQARREALAMPDEERYGYAEQGFMEANFKTRADEIAAKRLSGTDEEKEKYNFIERVGKEKGTDGKEREVIKRLSIDDIMTERGIVVDKSPDELRKEGRLNDAQVKEDFLADWDQAKAAPELQAEFKATIEQAKAGDAPAMKAVVDAAASHLNQRATKAETNATRIAGGKLTDEQVATNTKRLIGINERIAYLLKRKNDTERAGLSTAPIEAELEGVKREGAKIGIFNETAKNFAVDDTNRLFKAKPKTDQERKYQAEQLQVADNLRFEAEKYHLFAEAPTWDTKRQAIVRSETTMFDQQAQAASRRAEGLKDKAEKYVPPSAFYASRDRRLLENEELKKITTELDTELIAAFKDAAREGNTTKAAAIFKKLTNDGNDNELVNAYGFTSGSQGMHKFVRAVFIGEKGIKRDDTGEEYSGPSLGTDEQTAFSIENDIAFINESRNHWDTSRLIEVENGRYKQLSEKDHAKAALAEIMKKNTREVARAFNRLAYGGETPRADGSGRDFNIAMLGKAILLAMGPEIAEQIVKTGSEYNKNAVMNIGREVEKLKSIGVDSRYVAAAEKKSSELWREAGTSPGNIVDRLYQLEGVDEE